MMTSHGEVRGRHQEDQSANPWSKLLIAGTVGGACAVFTACFVLSILVCRRWIRRKQAVAARRRRRLHRRRQRSSTSTTSNNCSTSSARSSVSGRAVHNNNNNNNNYTLSSLPPHTALSAAENQLMCIPLPSPPPLVQRGDTVQTTSSRSATNNSSTSPLIGQHLARQQAPAPARCMLGTSDEDISICSSSIVTTAGTGDFNNFNNLRLSQYMIQRQQLQQQQQRLQRPHQQQSAARWHSDSTTTSGLTAGSRGLWDRRQTKESACGEQQTSAWWTRPPAAAEQRNNTWELTPAAQRGGSVYPPSIPTPPAARGTSSGARRSRQGLRTVSVGDDDDEDNIDDVWIRRFDSNRLQATTAESRLNETTSSSALPHDHRRLATAALSHRLSTSRT